MHKRINTETHTHESKSCIHFFGPGEKNTPRIEIANYEGSKLCHASFVRTHNGCGPNEFGFVQGSQHNS